MIAKDCIKSRRSIRKFKPDAVSHEVLEEVIATSAFAPSWKNTQITRYIAVEGEMKDKIANECTDAWPGNGKIIAAAPMLMVISIIKNRCGFERDGSFTTERGDSWQMFDAGVASQTFCLALHEAGLGGVIMGIFDHKKVGELLGLEDDREVVALIPIGYPDEEPNAPKRKEVSELLSYR